MEHTHTLPFPNGKGHTPCTEEYHRTKEQRDNICDLNNGESLAELDSQGYEEWSVLDDRLASMQLNGHTGRAVFY